MFGPGWQQAAIDQNAFEREQARLAHVWTFLGLVRDVAKDGDWFRASLATRSVFVQRFGDELKGFENVCAHRGHPLRTVERGNGPVVCAFHHWRYDKEGRALGIPKSEEMFGKIPRDLDARIAPLEIATCGDLIFGRFPAAEATQTLEAFLGESFPIVTAMSRAKEPPQRIVREVKANWRLCYHASVEEYHLAAVHPSTLGKIGYLVRENIGYFRIGAHSAYFTTNAPDAVEKMAQACRDGTWHSVNYRIFHLFPNLAISHFHADAAYWYILILQYVPVAHDCSTMRAWVYPAPFPAPHAWYERWLRPFTDPIRKVMVRYYTNRVLTEDNVTCAHQQSVIAQMRRPPILGALEERIRWFEEAYTKAVDGPES